MKTEILLPLCILCFYCYEVESKCCGSTLIWFSLKNGVEKCDDVPGGFDQPVADCDGVVGDIVCKLDRRRPKCRIEVCNDGHSHSGTYCGVGSCNMFGCNCDDGCWGGDDLQSLWLTSWFGYNNNSRGRNIVDAGVYTLQQPHKFPLQLDVYSGNCSFDYQQHELPSGHYQNQQQLKSAASTAQAQSTLSREQLKLKPVRERSGQRFLRNSSDFYETKFIESSAVENMDNMVYQCSNQNSIYVLNADYNPSYGDFGTHAASGREMNGSRTTARTSNSIGASCSSAACSLQHKSKFFGTTAASNSSAAMPSTTAAAVAAAAATTTTIIAAAMTTTTTGGGGAAATNYVNPVATSMSTAMCSPATTALQKLFNCSGVGVGVGIGVGSGNVCQNVSHRNQQQCHNSSSNNNCPVVSHNNSCLSATTSHSRICDPLELPAATGAAPAGGVAAGTAAGALPLLGAVANKKKCTNVKSTLIAKKTKFLKFLEEEKWRNNSNNIRTEDAPPTVSNEADLYTAMAMASASSLAVHSASKNNSSSSHEAAGAEQQQNKLNNWSMHNESNNNNNNKLTNYTQQQQEQPQEATTRSSYELYQEAADILGLSCSLCDNCRCLDCQSGYFDCAYDDDDESYSEQSLMDEYDEYNDDYSNAYSYEQHSSLLTAAHHNHHHEPEHAGVNQPTMIRSAQEEEEEEEEQQHQQEQQIPEATEQNLCYAVDCQQNCSGSEEGREPRQTISTATATTKSEHRLDIDFDLINATTSSQVLPNCATFNGLSLLDVEQQPLETFT